MLVLAIISGLIPAVGAVIGGAFYGYASVLRAKALQTWAERCDPKGTFQAPPEGLGSPSKMRD